MKYVVQSTLFTIALLLVAWLDPSHSEINIGKFICSWLTIMMMVNGPFVMSCDKKTLLSRRMIIGAFGIVGFTLIWIIGGGIGRLLYFGIATLLCMRELYK